MTISRQEIYKAKTLEALIELAHKHGRQSPQAEAWARNILRARKNKEGK